MFPILLTGPLYDFMVGTMLGGMAFTFLQDIKINR